MPKIKMFFLGEIHSDPVAPQVLKKTIEKLNKLKIPSVVCLEYHDDKTIEDQLNFFQAWDKSFKNLEILINFKDFFKKEENLSRPYLLREKRNKLAHDLMALNIPAMVIDKINYINNYKEYLELYKTLLSLKVPCIGIDRDINTNVNSSRLDYITALEVKRIPVMVENLISKGLPQHKDDGIIFILTGTCHTHRLAATFYQKYLDCSLNKKYEVEIIPLQLCSPYCKEDIEMVRHDEQVVSKSIDTQEMLKIYEILPFNTIFFEEKNGDFFAKQWDDKINHLINETKSDIYCIPDFTENKKKLIKEFAGEINNKKISNYETIRINRSFLTKDVRTQLGINCQKITLDEPEKQLAYLRLDPTITIEAESFKVYYVTFPNEIGKFSYIKKIVDNWKKFTIEEESNKKPPMLSREDSKTFVNNQQTWKKAEQQPKIDMPSPNNGPNVTESATSRHR